MHAHYANTKHTTFTHAARNRQLAIYGMYGMYGRWGRWDMRHVRHTT